MKKLNRYLVPKGFKTIRKFRRKGYIYIIGAFNYASQPKVFIFGLFDKYPQMIFNLP